LCVCLSVSATLMVNISETHRRFRGSCMSNGGDRKVPVSRQ